MTALAIIGLLPSAARVVGGQAFFDDRDMLVLNEAEMRKLRRGGPLAMVFQDPMSSLNPVMRVGEQVIEAIDAHTHGMDRAALRRRALEMSGGMRQRVMIATGLAKHPAS